MSHEAQHDLPLGDRARRRMLAQRATRRSASLTVATTIVPGLGLLRTRYRRLGVLVLLAIVLTALGVIGAVVLLGPTQAALAVAVRPSALLAAAVLLFFGGLIWIWTIILTNRGTRDPLMSRRQRAGLRTLTALLCLVVAVPIGTAVNYSLIQRDVVATLFGGAAAPDGDAETDGRPGVGPDPWAGVSRVNMLLLGSDAGDDRIGVRTDSMIVASVNPQTGDTLMFSLPRNLENVPFPKSNPLSKLYPKGYNCGPPDCLLNGVWSLAEANGKLFIGDRNPGLTTIRGVIQEITGMRMDYTTVVDLAGFEELVDAMGGVVITVTQDLPIGGKINASGQLTGVTGWIRKGTQRLDGFNALWFARSRVLSDDYDRMRRQRCLVGKILDQTNPAQMLQQYPELARVAKNNIQTDVNAADLPAWLELVQRMKGATIRSLTFTSLNIDPAHPDFAKMRGMIYASLHPELFTSTATETKTASSTKTSSSTKTALSTKTSTRTFTGATSASTATAPTKPTTDVLVDLKDAC